MRKQSLVILRNNGGRLHDFERQRIDGLNLGRLTWLPIRDNFELSSYRVLVTHLDPL